MPPSMQKACLTHEPIDPQAAIQRVRSSAAGAVVLFLGTARQSTEDRPTSSLDYEAHAEMAQAKLEELVAEAEHRWGLVGCTVVHRLGHLEIGQICVAVAVSSAHRRAAFQAGQWVMDRIKESVPIWKRENWADGTHEWVHPGVDSGPPPHPKDVTP